MALPLQTGLTPKEVAFLCEMEMITIKPRQRLESLQLLGGSTAALRAHQRATVPLWLALLLKRQKRADIDPPPWLDTSSLERILLYETETSPHTFSPPPPYPHSTSTHQIDINHVSPPFIPTSTATASPDYLPYHWLELGEVLLETCSDDISDAENVRRLLRDLREVRMAKMRSSVKELDGGGISSLRGVGAMEIAEGRAFIVGVMNGLRRLGQSREVARGERGDEVESGDEDSDINMNLR
ncbi:hypothetical protein K3495_g6005 [Podosphaera aphanis]|nr:hypothetical protein K3495_g6005 [Podosphaera aphanis]